MQKVLTREQIIEALSKTGDDLYRQLKETAVQEVIHTAYVRNNWFNPDFTEHALKQIIKQYLQADALLEFSSSYSFANNPRTVAIVMAGNIPLAGFHDWLCVMLSGHNALVKCSAKDAVLFPFWLNRLSAIAPELVERTRIVDTLKGFDAVIATGSNNTNRYFEYYFGKYPHIFRNNRSSVAILSGNESKEQLNALSDDIFLYFGLGCRSVSKLFLPEGYEVESLLPHFYNYQWLTQHSKYMNNYDYNRTVLLMNKTPHVANDFVAITQSESVHSPLALIHYEYYDSNKQLEERLMDQATAIQAIIGAGHLPFGKAQEPTLSQFSDNIDTMAFLQTI